MVRHLVINGPEEMKSIMAMLLEGEHVTFVRRGDKLTISCGLEEDQVLEVLNSPEVMGRLERLESR